jgi:hypothetical protein
MNFRIFFLFLLITNHLSAQSQYFSSEDLNPKSKANLEEKFILSEIPEYIAAKDINRVFLKNGYASAIIINPDDWQPPKQPYEVTEVNLIYTKYPVDKNLWRTNYRKLLTDRLKELFKLDSSLNSDEIEWGIVLQTNCKTEQETMLLPHGIEIVYELLPQVSETVITAENIQEVQSADSVAQLQTILKAEKQINKFIKNLKIGTDSIIDKVFARQNEWKKSLVVIDWTGSMQGFGAELMLWHTKNYKISGIKHMVIFNDGLEDKNRKNGKLRGVYFVDALDLKKVVKLMKKAGKEHFAYNKQEENDMEAIIAGMDKYKDFDELILIADNRSCIKDFCLTCKVNVPVRIILCGTAQGVNPAYVNLAYKTKGSLHTIENDIYDLPGATATGKPIKIDKSVFVFDARKDRYVEAGKKPKKVYQDCTKFYKKKKKKCKC